MYVWSLMFRRVLLWLSARLSSSLTSVNHRPTFQFVLGPEHFVKLVLPTHDPHGSSPPTKVISPQSPLQALTFGSLCLAHPGLHSLQGAAFTQLEWVGCFLCSDETTENGVPGEAVAGRKQGGLRLGEDPLQNYSPHPTAIAEIPPGERIPSHWSPV